MLLCGSKVTHLRFESSKSKMDLRVHMRIRRSRRCPPHNGRKWHGAVESGAVTRSLKQLCSSSADAVDLTGVLRELRRLLIQLQAGRQISCVPVIVSDYRGGSRQLRL
jgi:hypothetical protein